MDVTMRPMEKDMQHTDEQHTSSTSRGIRWSYRDVLRGKSGNIMVLEVAFFVALALVISLITDESQFRFGTALAGLVKDAFALKADLVATELSAAIVVLEPLLIVLWPLSAAILMLYYNLRDRQVERTEENLEYHRIEAARAWTWPWSIMVGAFDFTAAFVLIDLARTPLDAVISTTAQDMVTVLATLVCLVFAERRVTRASRAMAARRQGNRESVCAILDGRRDGLLPENYRTDFGRAKAATVVSRGIVRSARWGAIVARGIDVRTKVKLFSGFLNSTVHGILTAVSFGIAATAANSLGDVGGQFASGKGAAYLDSLRHPETISPHFVVEVLAVVVCNVYTTVVIVGEILGW